MGGVNAAAKKRIIIKKLAVLESLQRVNTIVFDKTGTITLGQPQLTTITIKDKNYTQQKILAIALAIERNSLHPLAKAIIQRATEQKVPLLHVRDVKEELGKGIRGKIENTIYHIQKLNESEAQGMQVELRAGVSRWLFSPSQTF